MPVDFVKYETAQVILFAQIDKDRSTCPGVPRVGFPSSAPAGIAVKQTSRVVGRIHKPLDDHVFRDIDQFSGGSARRLGAEDFQLGEITALARFNDKVADAVAVAHDLKGLRLIRAEAAGHDFHRVLNSLARADDQIGIICTVEVPASVVEHELGDVVFFAKVHNDGPAGSPRTPRAIRHGEAAVKQLVGGAFGSAGSVIGQHVLADHDLRIVGIGFGRFHFFAKKLEFTPGTRNPDCQIADRRALSRNVKGLHLIGRSAWTGENFDHFILIRARPDLDRLLAVGIPAHGVNIHALDGIVLAEVNSDGVHAFPVAPADIGVVLDYAVK